MNRHLATCTTLRTNEDGFTLVEVLVALLLIGTVGVVGMVGVRAASKAVTRSLSEVRFDSTTLQLDRVLRDAFTRLPRAYWGPPPSLSDSGGSYEVRDTADGSGYTITLKIVAGDQLLVTYAGRKVLVPGVQHFVLTSLKAEDGKVAGYRFEYVSQHHKQHLLLDFGGQRL